MAIGIDHGRHTPPSGKSHGLTINADLSQGPFYIDGQDTTPKLFRDRARALGTRTAHREKTFGIWRSHSWDAYFTHAKHLGLGLVSLGLQRGEVVSILSEDCKEWMYTDMGVQSVGGFVRASTPPIPPAVGISGQQFGQPVS